MSSASELNGYDDEEEAMNAAIRMSLQEAGDTFPAPDSPILGLTDDATPVPPQKIAKTVEKDYFAGPPTKKVRFGESTSQDEPSARPVGSNYDADSLQRPNRKIRASILLDSPTSPLSLSYDDAVAVSNSPAPSLPVSRPPSPVKPAPAQPQNDEDLALMLASMNEDEVTAYFARMEEQEAVKIPTPAPSPSRSNLVPQPTRSVTTLPLTSSTSDYGTLQRHDTVPPTVTKAPLQPSAPQMAEPKNDDELMAMLAEMSPEAVEAYFAEREKREKDAELEKQHSTASVPIINPSAPMISPPTSRQPSQVAPVQPIIIPPGPVVATTPNSPIVIQSTPPSAPYYVQDLSGDDSSDSDSPALSRSGSSAERPSKRKGIPRMSPGPGYVVKRRGASGAPFPAPSAPGLSGDQPAEAKSTSPQEEESEILQDFTNLTPYMAPQRAWRLNWVQPLGEALYPRNLKRTLKNELPKCLRLRDLISKEAKRVFLSTFKLDMLWLVQTCPVMLQAPTIVYHGEDDDVYHPELLPPDGKEATSREKLWNFITHASRTMGKTTLPQECPFSTQRVAHDTGRRFNPTPHGKIGLIQYPNFMRVFISTANLLEMDWERKTQGVWFQDFPLKTGVPDADERLANMTEQERIMVEQLAQNFVQTLKDYFVRLVGPDFNAGFFNSYDFRNVRVSLVSTVAASLAPELGQNYGYLKLGRLVGQEPPPPGLRHDSPYTIYMQFSSLGTLSPHYVESVAAAFCRQPTATVGLRPVDRLRLIWPSTLFVRSCIDGYIAGTSLCASKKNLREKEFVVGAMAPYLPPQEGRRFVPPHIKSYWKQYADRTLGWMCLTSSNFSKGAWGEEQKGPKFNMNNFEMGVLLLPSQLAIPASFGSDPLFEGATSVRMMSGKDFSIDRNLQDGVIITLPMPFDHNAAKYSPTATPEQQPWVWDLRQDLPDVRGMTFPGVNFGSN